MPTLVIIRGVPGSGKSTLARLVASRLGYEHYEADMYHTYGGGFRFFGHRASDAHRWCQTSARDAIRRGVGAVVGNPLLGEWDVADYTGMSDDVIIVSLEHTYGSTHAPLAIERRMRAMFEHHDEFAQELPAHVRTMTEEELVAWVDSGIGASPPGLARPLRIPRD